MDCVEWSDADVHAKLIDLYPPTADYPQGFPMNLSEGLLHFEVNPNSGEPEVSSARPRIATIRSFTDRDHPAHLVLPLIPDRR
ncbi:MAG: hypothetical protein JO162_14705 [Alphaproteobacteria bacterium]|nr:hypothetical protein [Alphaproteobacteria bacterium]